MAQVRIVAVPGVDAQIKRVANHFLEDVVEQITDDARRLAAVDTGEMQDSVFGEVVNGSGRVGATAEHSRFVELGTENMPAQPFLRPALYKKRGPKRGLPS